MDLTKEQIEKLSEFDDILKEITKGNIGISPEKKKKLRLLYKEISNSTVCSSCSNSWIIRLASWYKINKQKYEKRSKGKSKTS